MSNPQFVRPGSRLPWPVMRPVGDQKHGQSISINRQICVIGARSRVHLPLESSQISRTHALIINDRDETYVRDLASTNRVYINGSSVREARLNKADMLRIGPFTFFCHSGFPAAADLLEADAGGPSEKVTISVEGTVRQIAMQGRTLLIGNRQGCDLRLEHSTVSRTHAIIYCRDGKRFLRDLNSTTGTFVNDRRIREAELKDGYSIRVGVSILKVLIERVETQYDQKTQLRLMDRDDAGSMMSVTGMSMSRVLSASASFGGGTMAAASLAEMTIPGGMYPRRSPQVEDDVLEAQANDLGLSGAVVLPEPMPPLSGGTLSCYAEVKPRIPSIPAQGRDERISKDRPGSKPPTGAALRGFLGKFTSALSAAETESMPCASRADVRPVGRSGEVIIPTFDKPAHLEQPTHIANKPPTPTDLRGIEVATPEDLFAPTPKPRRTSRRIEEQASHRDLLDDAFLRDVGL